MRGYSLTGRADADLRQIAVTSRTEWGLAQARNYARGLRAAFERIVEFPDLGREAESFGPGYRQIRQGRHIIFYTPQGDRIRIIRVLHDRMDTARHLN